jgi:transposase-like protein
MAEAAAPNDHIGGTYDEDARTATLKRAEGYTFFRMVGAVDGQRILDMAEQDHRGVKRITHPILGFKSFDAAQSTLVDIELMHMLRKGQLADGVEQALTVAKQFYALAA